MELNEPDHFFPPLVAMVMAKQILAFHSRWSSKILLMPLWDLNSWWSSRSLAPAFRLPVHCASQSAWFQALPNIPFCRSLWMNFIVCEQTVRWRGIVIRKRGRENQELSCGTVRISKLDDEVPITVAPDIICLVCSAADATEWGRVGKYNNKLQKIEELRCEMTACRVGSAPEITT